MNLHEYQAKELFASYGIPVLSGKPARNPQEARDVAEALGGESWVIKAQVHAGGRGKAGGVRKVDDLAGVEQVAAAMLGSRLTTHQTGPAGLPVNEVLIETPCTNGRELYLGAVVDRSRARVVFMCSALGGMDIEEVAAHQPEQILTAAVDPAVGLQPYQCRQVGFKLGLDASQLAELSSLMQSLYQLFVERDASLVEINPLVVTEEGKLLALDAKVVIDDNALFRQKALLALRDESQEDPRENAAQQHQLNYIHLDGNIGCMVNGAGLAMATMDLIKLHGGEPANFLDVGGGTTAARVAEAFKLILSDAKVKVVLVNIFGGIVRCDLIAEGIITAVTEVGIRAPVVVRLEGTNVERGRELLHESGLAVTTAYDLTEAAREAVALAGEK